MTVWNRSLDGGEPKLVHVVDKDVPDIPSSKRDTIFAVRSLADHREPPSRVMETSTLRQSLLFQQEE